MGGGAQGQFGTSAATPKCHLAQFIAEGHTALSGNATMHQQTVLHAVAGDVAHMMTLLCIGSLLLIIKKLFCIG